MTEEKTTITENPERVPRPEEIVPNMGELPEEQRLRPVRCRAGKSTDNPCPRDATTWMFPEKQDYPLCDEHVRAYELSLEVMARSTVEDITGDWLRIARAWGFEDLEQYAVNCHESAKEELLKAEARADLAREIADPPIKGRRERIRDLTPAQDAESHRLIARSDALVTAYTVLEDAPEELIRPDAKRRAMGVLAEEKDRANEEAHRFHEELGIRPK